MKVEWRTVLGASLFLGATALVYGAYKNHPVEASGVTMLAFGFFAYGLLFGYLLLVYLRRDRIPRPEDRFDATSADGEGEVGYFPNASIWPAAMGLGMIIGVVGFIYGLWFTIIGGVLLTVINLFTSYRHGEIAGDNPWDGQTLEWACSSPPPDHNFEALPPIRSERPLWDANHPDQLTKVGH